MAYAMMLLTNMLVPTGPIFRRAGDSGSSMDSPGEIILAVVVFTIFCLVSWGALQEDMRQRRRDPDDTDSID